MCYFDSSRLYYIISPDGRVRGRMLVTIISTLQRKVVDVQAGRARVNNSPHETYSVGRIGLNYQALSRPWYFLMTIYR